MWQEGRSAPIELSWSVVVGRKSGPYDIDVLARLSAHTDWSAVFNWCKIVFHTPTPPCQTLPYSMVIHVPWEWGAKGVVGVYFCRFIFWYRKIFWLWMPVLAYFKTTFIWFLSQLNLQSNSYHPTQYIYCKLWLHFWITILYTLPLLWYWNYIHTMGMKMMIHKGISVALAHAGRSEVFWIALALYSSPPPTQTNFR